MKKIVSLLFIVLLTCTGCAQMATKRGVQKNTIYSTNPELALKLAPEFEYIENKKNNDFIPFPQGNSGRSKSDIFVFADRLTRAIVVVNITRIYEGMWVSDVNAGIKHLLESGKEKYHGVKYQFGVFAKEDREENCHLVKRTARVTGPMEDTLVQILYMQQLKADGTHLEQWQDVEHLTEEQKATLNSFLESSKEKVEFVALANLNISK